MGAYFDSMAYDVFGYSDEKHDSVILENTCYHVSPSPYLLDVDFIAANSVQPVVCVDSINEGVDITVSVSFVETSHTPRISSDVVSFSTTCSTSTASTDTFTMSAKALNMIHVKGMGDGGSVTLSLSSDFGWSTAFFYDG